jgi:surface antigen
MRGNAKTWANVARSSPDYKVLDHPVVGSIACRDTGTYGHVAWVVAVSGDTVTVTEENCCTGCNYGMRQHTYKASYFTGGYAVRAKDQCQCDKGDTET